MELVDENEGYDSEEDNDLGQNGERIVNFLDDAEMPTFSLGNLRKEPLIKEPLKKEPVKKDEEPKLTNISDINLDRSNMSGEEMAQFEDLMGIEKSGEEAPPKFYLGPPKAKTD